MVCGGADTATPPTGARSSGLDVQDGGKVAEGLRAARRRGGENKELVEGRHRASPAGTTVRLSAPGQRTPAGRGSTCRKGGKVVGVLAGPGGKQAAEDVREHGGSVETAEEEVRRPGDKVRAAEDGEVVPVD